MNWQRGWGRRLGAFKGAPASLPVSTTGRQGPKVSRPGRRSIVVTTNRAPTCQPVTCNLPTYSPNRRSNASSAVSSSVWRRLVVTSPRVRSSTERRTSVRRRRPPVMLSEKSKVTSTL